MPKHIFRISGAVVALVLAASLAPVVAEEAVPQSAPATPAREALGDWSVGCATPAVEQPTDRICTFAQEQFDKQSHQRVLGLELQPDGAGAKGVLVLPFGLDVQKGVTLQADEGKPFSVSRISHCLPIGCVVEVKLDAATMARLDKSKALKVNATINGGKQVSFDISLKGFKKAFNRTKVLAMSKQQGSKS
ncbi:invasion associated locus B family protein [Pseudomonas putida]|uniref:invasion associated locus B family protein n=1 Tax=Pseudomonas putida TaxID=303 RepID=UPI0023654163|nr:invasion associated locus B family protein [Pseudomonas putida]MDD2049941.1 invasion associated locus B family protein [Pseudomonas putida]